MNLILSFTSMLRHLPKIDFKKDLFFFGCGEEHVLPEPDYEARKDYNVPWSEWVMRLRSEGEDPRAIIPPIRAALLAAHREGRVEFAKKAGSPENSNIRLARFLDRNNQNALDDAFLLAIHRLYYKDNYSYPGVIEAVGQYIECLW